jgi:predicted transposase YbfD/YdcC
MSDPVRFPYLPTTAQCSRLRTLVKLRRQRRLTDKTTVEGVYYISCLPKTAAHLLEAIRSHWSIENRLHWVLVLAVPEDESRVRNGNSPHNFPVLPHRAVNLLNHQPTPNLGVKAKRLIAASSDAYWLMVLRILFHFP